MKKTLLIVTLAALTQLSSIGQGYFSVGGPPRGSWDIFTAPGISKFGATMNIAVLWAPAATTATVETVMNGTPTNSPSMYAVNPWLAIQADLGAGGYKIAMDNNTGLAIQPSTGANSSWVYTTTGGFSSVPVTGTAAGTAYNIYVVGWDKTAGTLANAASTGAAVGWSKVFTYNSVDSIGTPASLANSGFVPFGVNAVPEPGTFALAGLGIASMLIARRRK